MLYLCWITGFKSILKINYVTNVFILIYGCVLLAYTCYVKNSYYQMFVLPETVNMILSISLFQIVSSVAGLKGLSIARDCHSERGRNYYLAVSCLATIGLFCLQSFATSMVFNEGTYDYTDDDICSIANYDSPTFCCRAFEKVFYQRILDNPMLWESAEITNGCHGLQCNDTLGYLGPKLFSDTYRFSFKANSSKCNENSFRLVAPFSTWTTEFQTFYKSYVHNGSYPSTCGVYPPNCFDLLHRKIYAYLFVFLVFMSLHLLFM